MQRNSCSHIAPCLWVHCHLLIYIVVYNFVYLRPDHVSGVESVTEHKTKGNTQKRKESVERIKSKEEGQSLVTNGSLHTSLGNLLLKLKSHIRIYN